MNSISVNGNNGGIALGNVESTGGRVVLGAAQSVLAGNVRAAGSIAITSNGAVTAGDLTAGTGPLVGEGNGGLGSGAQSSAPAGIAPGFNAFTLTRCDDCASGATPLSFTANFFGTNFTNTFVSSNGYLTFNSGQSSYTPTGLGANYSGQPIIAAFFADVDVRGVGSAPVTYGTGTYVGRNAFGATWNGVGYFSSRTDKLNNFQIILSDRADTGAGNFDIYLNYTNVQWETGNVNGGVNGLGGNSAAVGFNAGTGNQAGTFFELPGSRVPGSFINGGTSPLAQYSANGVQGQVLFNVRNGMVVTSDAGPATVTINNSGATGAARNVAVGNITGEAVSIDSAGSVATGNITIAGANGASVPTPSATMPSAGIIDISAAAGDIAVGGMSNTGIISLDAAGNITINGASSGGAISFASNDITIGANASVTGQTINLLSRSTTGPAMLGGTGGNNAYVLDAAEISRLRAGSIAFSQPESEGRVPGGDAQVIVRDLTLIGSAGATPNLIGAEGSFTISSPGSIRVIGNVRLNDAGADNLLSFAAGDSFDLVTDAGSVGVFGTGNALGGRLSIFASDMTVADQALFDLAARTDFDDVTAPEVIAAIGRPAARTRPEGYLQAGNLDLVARDFIAIQNSGTAQLAGGFSANNLTITSLAGGREQTIDNSLNVVIYGRVTGPTGDFLTNQATRDAITFVTGESSGDLTGFSAPSVVNGCVIGGGACSTSNDTATPATIVASIRDLVDGPLSGQQGDQAFSVPSVQIETGVDLSALTTSSIITEPVASAGNASLWQSATLSDGSSGLIQSGRRGLDNAPQRKKLREKRR
ncbi:hypothetical protein EOD43_17690 [Sphingomonas crocodyli]|uniref:NIDO domain-containing protein n=2 Tax=Sphingomonas crocodyli TaxID=1979270 RepID=A0A437LYQ8_9SPHN|nr:hypothetical protein EOD43_17690 [Sphingomonas crocodyli]